jgi:predicted nucleic-acid-binding protein
VLAVDTNVLVRLVTNDDPAQAQRAAGLFSPEDICIPKSVPLETEWVLRYSYALSRERILHGLRGLLGLDDVSVEDPAAVARAVDWYATGLDFADALHVASSAPAGRFATFDTRLVKQADAAASMQIVPA